MGIGDWGLGIGEAIAPGASSPRYAIAFFCLTVHRNLDKATQG
ncbi:MAG: hypothetical protein HEQ35_31460 [Gloeotrichia echinulata IR180]